MTRLPFDPLERLLRAAADLPLSNPETDGWNSRRAAVMLGASVESVRQWRRRGLSGLQADRIATRFGLHPLEVWGDDWIRVSNHEETCAHLKRSGFVERGDVWVRREFLQEIQEAS